MYKTVTKEKLMKKKIITFALAFIPMLVSCVQPEGGSTTFSATLITETAYKTEKSFTYKNHSFKYYNVRSDGSGNFVMVDNTSYIANFDITFGLKVKTPYVYTHKENDETFESTLVTKMYDTANDEGYYSYSVSERGFIIRGCDKDSTTTIKDINIGKIIIWC